MIKTIISLLVFMLFLPFFTFFMVQFIILSYFIHPRKLYYPIIPITARVMMLISFQWYSIEGKAPKKDQGPYIFMFNHESMFDVFMLGGAIPYYVNAVGWEGLQKWPIFGFFIKRYGFYPITHDNTDKAKMTLKSAEKILVQDGDSMVFSPEGQRTLTGEMNEFKKGGFHFAKNTNIATIVPVGLIGAYRANVRNSWIVNPGKLTTVFGKPITPSDYKDLSVEELRDLTKKRISELLV